MRWASSLFDEETVGVSTSFRPARRKNILVSKRVKIELTKFSEYGRFGAATF
jgi:hypothetical protein